LQPALFVLCLPWRFSVASKYSPNWFWSQLDYRVFGQKIVDNGFGQIARGRHVVDFDGRTVCINESYEHELSVAVWLFFGTDDASEAWQE
jgi:hypothetical protein